MSDLVRQEEHPIEVLEKMAHYLVQSGLFGIKTQAQAMGLMILAQAKGMHPGTIAEDYHLIGSKPSLKADTMLTRFQAAGGSVSWGEYTDTRVEGTFSHPQGGKLTVDWDMDRARKAGLGVKDTWRQYPRAMLRARVISEGIRTVFPGVLGGMYTPEEVIDFDDAPKDQDKKPRQENRKAPSAPPKPPKAPESLDEKQRLDFVAFCEETGLPFSEVEAYLNTRSDPVAAMKRALSNKDGFIKAFGEWKGKTRIIEPEQREDDIPI
jgi:hypothetical protein